METLTSGEEQSVLEDEIQALCADLGEGKIRGVAYDTAWVARLAPLYPEYGFDSAVEWLRRHQHMDGTWGSPLFHHHDRFVSTLAAITALREVGRGRRDERRIKRGEDALWRLVGRLNRDDSDTIGFPIISISLAEEALKLGLDVPQPSLRFAEPYKQKVKALLNHPERLWRHTTVTFSFEALRFATDGSDDLLEANHSVAVSPSATAAWLLEDSDSRTLDYLHKLTTREAGAAPAVAPIDVFEIAWSFNHLRKTGAINPNDSDVKCALQYLWQYWLPEKGVGYSSYMAVPDVDDTAACFSVLQWGGYPVNADVFAHFEMDDHFCCFHGETNPSISAQVRLLDALRMCEDHPRYPVWVEKIVNLLRKYDENGSFWWDKWHSSPYYANAVALSALHGIADDLATLRYKWIIRTQNDDGGWGYFHRSTPEETAYCLEALLLWDRDVERVERSVLDRAAQYLQANLTDTTDLPMWIGKSLYTPVNPVKAAVLSALYGYMKRDGQ